jgi:nucleoside-diphosphate-sugar epimerase
MKALVTGANGFLGSYLVRVLLDRGHEVTAMTRRRDEVLAGMGVRTVHADVRSFEGLLEAFPGHEVVFHTASVSGIWGSWKHFHSNNTIGARNVVEACLKAGIPKLVYTSSPSVTFNGEDQTNVNESVGYPRKWLCHYPHSKALAEQYVLQADGDPDLMTCALRPHLIWGPGDRHLVPRLIERARAKQLRRVGDGTNQIDHIFVENAAVAHLQAAEAMKPGSPVCGSAYFISQGEPVNCWAWINEILSLARIPRIKRSISFKTAYRLGAVLEAYHEFFQIQREPRMTRFLAAQLAKDHFFDTTRAQRDFGFRPAISTSHGMSLLEDSLARMS